MTRRAAVNTSLVLEDCVNNLDDSTSCDSKNDICTSDSLQVETRWRQAQTDVRNQDAVWFSQTLCEQSLSSTYRGHIGPKSYDISETDIFTLEVVDLCLGSVCA
jgi:hypothetical protein